METKNSRSKESRKLLTYGLTNFDTIKIATKNKEITQFQVWQGKENKVSVYVNKNIYKTIPKARKKYLKIVAEYDGPVKAPIKENQVLGMLKIFYKDELIDEVKLFSLSPVDRLNIFSRILKSINFLVWGDV